MTRSRECKYPFETHFAFTQGRLKGVAEAVRCLGVKQVECACSVERGLHAITYASGSIVLYSRVSLDRRPQRIRLGELGLITLEQARQQHRAYRLQASRGENPRAPKVAQLLYRDLNAQHYVVQCQSRGKKTLSTDLARYARWIGPEFGDMRVADITKTHVSRFVLKMQEAGLAASTIRSTISQLRCTLDIAVELGVLGRNPATGLRLPRLNNRRTEFLSVAQMQAFTEAAQASEQTVGSRMLIIMALTGARLGEAVAAQWEHIRLAENAWLLPTQKSGRPGVIELSEAVKEVFRELMAVRRNPYVFPGERGNAQLSRPIKLFRRLCKQAGIPSTFRIHDLRHAWVSAGVNAGISLEIMSQGARHSSPVVTRIYSHAERESLRSAQARIAQLYMADAPGASAPERVPAAP